MQIKWLRPALLDLEGIETYIANENPVAAVDTVLKIINTVTLLKEQRGIGRAGLVPGIRELIVPDLPDVACLSHIKKMAEAPLVPFICVSHPLQQP